MVTAGNSKQSFEGSRNKILDKKPVIYGAIASLLLILFYFAILTWVGTSTHAIQQFQELWPWMSLLIIGFGFQVGMFFNTRILIKARAVHGATGAAAGAAGVSAGSMVACCLHHATDVLPIIGISAFAIFLTQYQILFLILGILSNLVGITFMLSIMQTHGLLKENGKIRKYSMKKVRNLTIAASVLILAISFVVITVVGASSEVNSMNKDSSMELDLQISDENMVSVEVTPLINSNKKVEFYVALNTHSVDLGFELTEISELSDNLGNVYEPVSWEGSPPGGHHRYGTLSFPKIDSEATDITLNIYDISSVSIRTFTWSLDNE